MMRVHPVATALVLLFLVSDLSAISLALARPFGDRAGHGLFRGGPAGPMIEEHAERLGLDAETVEAIRKIVEKARARGDELHNEAQKAHEMMRSLLMQDTPDETAVMQQVETIGAVELEAQKNRLRAMLQIRALLTSEQRQELMRIRKESHPRQRHRRLGACHADVAKLCPEAQPGRATVQCLSDQWTSLSDTCRSAFERRPRERFLPPTAVKPE